MSHKTIEITLNKIIEENGEVNSWFSFSDDYITDHSFKTLVNDNNDRKEFYLNIFLDFSEEDLRKVYQNIHFSSKSSFLYGLEKGQKHRSMISFSKNDDYLFITINHNAHLYDFDIKAEQIDNFIKHFFKIEAKSSVEYQKNLESF